jgi:hypothetical protein
MTMIANTARIAAAATGRAMTVRERAEVAADECNHLDMTMTFQFNEFFQGFTHGYYGRTPAEGATDSLYYSCGYEQGQCA